jgi:hypothetical protein
MLPQNNSQIMAAAPAYPVAMMSPAYIMAYVQMPVSGTAAGVPMNVMSQAGMASANPQGMTGEAAGAATSSGHVTANPTNSMATNAMSMSGSQAFGSPAMAGYGGFGGVGSYSGYAMPVMMMAPVFLQMGYPMVFQGAVAQPPLAGPDVSDSTADIVPVSADTPAIPAAPELDVEIDAVPQAPVNTDGVVVDVQPQAAQGPSSATLPTLPITSLQADDFSNYRLLEKSRQLETNLSFSLTTKDGDQITLNFSQIDGMSLTRFNGESLQGEQMKDRSFREETDRTVNMEVLGDLSDDEKAAIDKVMSTVIDVVNSFFTGNVGDAVAKLKAMEFDGGQLAEMSLNMSMTKSAVVSKAYHDGGDYLHDLKNRDADISQALEYMATEQKRLIDMAKDVFDAPSAAKLVRSLVPPMMSEPFAELAEKISAPVSQVAVDDDETTPAQA